ncbi:MAG: hypothetical protein ACRDKG_11125 [Actinomycetota bacterium]
MDETVPTGSPETPETRDAEPSPGSEAAGTVRGMSSGMSPIKAAVLSTVIGLLIAGGIFAGLGLPGSLGVGEASGRYTVVAEIDEKIYVGLGPIDPSGRKIEILSVELVAPSPAVQVDGIRITRFNDPNPILLGSGKGERPDIDALPDALGAILNSGDKGGFWVGFRVTATGMHGFEGVRITYRSGWLTRSAVVGPPVQVRVGEVRSPGNGQGTPRPRPTRSR